MTLTEPTCFLTQTGTFSALDAADTWRRPHNGHWTPGHCILIMRTETKIAWISSWVSSLDSFKVNLIHQGAKKFYWSQDSITDGCLVLNCECGLNWIVLKAIIGLYFVFFGCCSPKIAGVVKVVGDHYDPRSCRMVGGREGWAQSDSVTIHCKFHSVFVLCPVGSE